jgi:hypothetical protein
MKEFAIEFFAYLHRTNPTEAASLALEYAVAGEYVPSSVSLNVTSDAVSATKSDCKTARCRFPARTPALVAIRSCWGVGEERYLDAARAQESTEVCNSAFATKRRPRSIAMPANPIRTARIKPNMIAETPLSP